MTTLSSRDTNRAYASTVEVDPFREPAHVSDEREKEFLTPAATVAINGRNVEVPEHFRIYLSDKLARLERFRPTIRIFEVNLFHEKNPRQSKACQRLEITVRGRGVARAEARSDTFYGALEEALNKLQSNLRRANDRKKVHHGRRTPVSVAEATASADPAPEPSDAEFEDVDLKALGLEEHEPGRIVRTKDHPSIPMSVDDALYEMELVGHDFFLFFDKETEKPSVVYRRHAFDYGLIRLT
ncbi:ribosome-associated translation inhibitor RaiA [Tsukamurella sp. 8F]|uniref:ribosome hibernation-promoting factor, HPF/YfiA family n=1 Tax=unclassified Tsukamurella TaxID=2633480 RepID=UPI0023B9AC53|nr:MULTISPECIES: ribosome-associated translation inhibitor RaiA [unclassified Tsukamurella]MDF0529047.1 ribosome-associated translation inhibitor RaiA [Tsukamurella sp. 8J]MDF0587420.1 ribosome-associated translation inhibitor RaiA [Tsukamurella sp. 8F]